MKKKLVARTAKLLSENKRFKSDSGVSIAYEHQPKDPDERKHGILFAVIEIVGPVSSAEDIAELIIDQLHNEYYRDLDKDPEESFESALAKINEELTEITEQGKINWLGKLNGIVAVLADNTLHITQAGKSEAILYRGDKSNEISEGLAGDAINPLRTFINIASGDLAEGDRVGIFSPGIFYHLSKEEVERYVKEFHPNVAINHLANIVEENNGGRRSSAIILEILTPEALAGDNIHEASQDEVWITDSRKGVEAVTDTAAPIAMKVAKGSAGFLGKISAFISQGIIPFIVAQHGKVKGMIQGRAAGKDNIFIETKEALSSSRTEVQDFESPNAKEDSFELKEKKPLAQEKPERSSLVFSTFKNFASSAASGAKKSTKFLPKNTKTIAIAIIAIFLITNIVISVNKRRTENLRKESEEIYQEAVSKFDEAENFIILNENDKAVEILNESKELAEEVKTTKYYNEEADTLLGKIAEKIDAASGIVRISGSPFADLSSVGAASVTGVTLIGENLYVVGSSDGNIYAINLGSGEASAVASNQDIEGNVVAISDFEDSTDLAILTDTPQVYIFDTKDQDLTKSSVSGGEWESGVDIATFGTNIYIANQADGQIYKHLKSGSGFGRKIEYVKDEITLSNIVSIAIDGSVYSLNSDGSVIKFGSGNKKDFAISGLPETISSPKKIYTNSEIKMFFIVDGNKVIRLDEKNNFVSQYTSDNFSDIDDVYSDGTSLYVLSGNKIYKISL